MLNEDCLNIRLGDYLDRRRDPRPEAVTDAAIDEGEAASDDTESGGSREVNSVLPRRARAVVVLLSHQIQLLRVTASDAHRQRVKAVRGASTA